MEYRYTAFYQATCDEGNSISADHQRITLDHQFGEKDSDETDIEVKILETINGGPQNQGYKEFSEVTLTGITLLPNLSTDIEYLVFYAFSCYDNSFGFGHTSMYMKNKFGSQPDDAVKIEAKILENTQKENRGINNIVITGVTECHQ